MTMRVWASIALSYAITLAGLLTAVVMLDPASIIGLGRAGLMLAMLGMMLLFFVLLDQTRRGAARARRLVDALGTEEDLRVLLVQELLLAQDAVEVQYYLRRLQRECERRVGREL